MYLADPVARRAAKADIDTSAEAEGTYADARRQYPERDPHSAELFEDRFPRALDKIAVLVPSR